MRILSDIYRRHRWLKAWKLVALNRYGDIGIQQEYAERFNSFRFFWKKELNHTKS